MRYPEDTFWTSIAAIICTIAICVGLANCGMTVSRNYTERHEVCVRNGGTWVPTGDTNAACIGRNHGGAQ